jgi:hypothetical protein
MPIRVRFIVFTIYILLSERRDFDARALPLIGFVVLQRAVAGGSSNHSVKDSETDKICHVSTPCGWAVYEPISRKISYFLRNT